jgi:hypothetical protein
MAMGMKNMLATTWSSASATKVAVGHQIATIFETVSRAETECQTARQTSQFAGVGVLLARSCWGGRVCG